MNIVIATSTTDDATERLRAFQQGEGDVLIVKQMGGVGMDVPRLKVCLDLSTVRTLNAFVQRVCRTATMWNPTGDPEDMVRTATYITPADAPARALWDEFVEKEGGNAETRVTLEYLGEQEEALREPQLYLPDTFVLTEEPSSVGEMVDSQRRSAPGEQWSVVQKLTGLLPELTKTRTEPELANILTENHIVFGDEPPASAPVPTPSQTPQAPQQVIDLYSDQKAMRDYVNSLARRIARKRRGGGALDEQFGEAIKGVHVDHRRRCGISWGTGHSLKDLSVEQLRKMADSMLEELEG